MLYMMMFMLMILTLIFLLLFINIFISMKTEKETEKPSPIECGINPFSKTMVPFSLQFFLITIIFIIFDIEIALIIPHPISGSSEEMYLLAIISFLMILLIGFYHEWKNGALNWNK